MMLGAAPLFYRLFIYPESESASVDQGFVIFRPVGDAVLGFAHLISIPMRCSEDLIATNLNSSLI
jgi:hypothetical protein